RAVLLRRERTQLAKGSDGGGQVPVGYLKTEPLSFIRQGTIGNDLLHDLWNDRGRHFRRNLAAPESDSDALFHLPNSNCLRSDLSHNLVIGSAASWCAGSRN